MFTSLYVGEKISNSKVACVSRRLEVVGLKERTGARVGDTQGVKERMHGRPTKIVSTRIL